MRFALAALVALGPGCFEATIPANAGSAPAGAPQPAGGVPAVSGGNPLEGTPDAGAPVLTHLDGGGTPPANDASPLPTSCQSHCDCPGGLACINAQCVTEEIPILCCTAVDCPTGQTCWFADLSEGSCP